MQQTVIPVLIPSLEPNERLLALLKALNKNGIGPIVLVNDGSSSEYDAIFAKAQAMGCTVLTHCVNLGKGRALKTGFNYCINTYPNCIGCVTADADGQHTPHDIARCLEALRAQPQHLVLGCRDFSLAHVPAKSSLGNRITRFVMKWLCGVRVTDTQTGLRAISAAFMKQLMNTAGERFEFETNMLLATRTYQVPIAEETIETVYLDENKGSHFHPVRDSARIYGLLFRSMFTSAVALVFGKFLFSSLSSAVVDIVAFSLLVQLLRPVSALWYIPLATLMARVLSALYNYFVNSVLVFRKSSNTSLLKYAILCAVQMAASAALVWGLFGLFGGSEVGWKVFADIVLFFISFQIQRRFVFVNKQ